MMIDDGTNNNQLNVKWTNYIENMVIEASGLPKELIVNASGYTMIEQAV